jgi:hypothetical protein
MDGTNPIYVLLLLVMRLAVPILIAIGVTQLLERWGLVEHNPKPPKNW